MVEKDGIVAYKAHLRKRNELFMSSLGSIPTVPLCARPRKRVNALNFIYERRQGVL